MTQGLEDQSLPLCPLGDQEDKNIYGWLSSLWGRAHTEQGCVSLRCDCSLRIAGLRQTQVVYRPTKPQRPLVADSFPFLLGT